MSSLDSQLEKIAGQLKAQEAKCRELDNTLKIKESEWKIDKVTLEEKAKAVSLVLRDTSYFRATPLCNILVFKNRAASILF